MPRADCTYHRSTKRSSTCAQSVTSHFSTFISCVSTWHTTPADLSTHVDDVIASSHVMQICVPTSGTSTKALVLPVNPRRRRVVMAARSVTSMHPHGTVVVCLALVSSFLYLKQAANINGQRLRQIYRENEDCHLIQCFLGTQVSAPKQDLDPFSRVCTVKLYDKLTDAQGHHLQ